MSDDDILTGTKDQGTRKGICADQISCDESLAGLDLDFISTSTSTFGSSPLTAATIPNSVPSSQLPANVSCLPEIVSRDTVTATLDNTGDWIEADLDQMYFDRVHALMPLIHRTWYFSWARQQNKPGVRVALQLAMRTLAAAASFSLQQLSMMLYADARQILEKLDDADERESTGSMPLEHIQAWLLLAHYEFIRKPYRRAMMTAGRAFRMVQVALLHQVDACDPDVAAAAVEAEPSRWIEAEQKRRTFWVAYCLDRCAGLHGSCPLTFHEDGIRTRLPASEVDFENSRVVCTGFLSEAIATSDQGMSSALAGCAMLLTLWGRCMAYRPCIPTDIAHLDDSLEVCERLNDVIEARRGQLRQCLSALGVLADPMLVFTCLIADVVLIHLVTTQRPTKALPAAYREQAAVAVEEMVTLAESLNQPSQFTTHTFVPNALFHGVRILKSRAVTEADITTASKLVSTLQSLGSVNQLAQDLLQRLERDSLSEPQQVSGVALHPLRSSIEADGGV
ncbi:fungal-specific transcription factor domain-containing protein [Hypoxylon cercidicola]|nr:fungal-specific transcription factor domain-containing protein [Hypoxylon cercidicola]